MTTRDFKGVWIPKEIWLNDSLTLQEKVFLAEIESLDNDEGCFATNEYFSQFFKISRVRVSEVIASLVRKGFISSEIHHEEKKGNIRVLRTLLKVSLIGVQRKVEEGIKGKFNRGIKESLTAVIGINNTVNNPSNNTKDNSAAKPLEPPFVKIEDIDFDAEKEKKAPPIAAHPPRYTMTVTKAPRIFTPHIHPENAPALAHFDDPQRMAELWEKWLNYKWGEHKQKYKTAESEVTQLRSLWKKCKGLTEQAAQIIEQSVGNQWKGLFDIKEERYGTPRPTNKATEQHLNLALYVAKRQQDALARANGEPVGGTSENW